MAYQFGDVVLVPFPFTDQPAAKQRPGVIVSSLAYHRARRDLILMPITSQVRGKAFLAPRAVRPAGRAGSVASAGARSLGPSRKPVNPPHERGQHAPRLESTRTTDSSSRCQEGAG